MPDGLRVLVQSATALLGMGLWTGLTPDAGPTAAHDDPTPNTRAVAHDDTTPQAHATAHDDATPQTRTVAHDDATPQARATAHDDVTPRTRAVAHDDPTPQARATAHDDVTPRTRTTMFDRVRPVIRPARREPMSAGGVPCLDSLSVDRPPEGDMPRAVAMTRDGRTALVVNRDTDNLAFFDIAGLEVATLLRIGDFPVDVAATPDGRFAVIPNVFSNTVSVVDVAARTVVADVSVTGDQPYRVAITSDSRLVVVGVINTGRDATFSIVDLESMTEVRSFPSGPQGVIGGFFTPESGISGNIFTRFALSPDDRTIVLPDRFGARVRTYDLARGVETASISTAPLPGGVDITRDGKRAVVTHEGNEKLLSVIDVITGRVSQTVPVSDGLRGQTVRITPDGRFAMVTALNHVLFVDMAATRNHARLFTGSPGDIVFSFDDRFAFVSNATARVIDIGRQRIVSSIPLGPCVEAAASPIANIAVALNNRFREDVQVYDINGPSGRAVGKNASGPEPEGDAPRTVAMSPDGRVAVVTHNTSDGVSIVDVESAEVRGIVPVGARPLGVAVTPDGRTAVVANAGDDTVSIIDIEAGAPLAVLDVPQVPAEVVIAPDSRTAYVSSVGGTDRVHFIALNGANSRVVGSLATGQMGLIQYTFNVFSGLALSPDGAWLAVCVTFDDQVLLVDTRRRRAVARVDVGEFPIRAAFSPDGSRLFVTSARGDDLQIIRIDGESSRVEGVAGPITFPLTVSVGPLGAFAYVGSFDSNAPRMVVVDVARHAIVRSIDLPAPPRAAVLTTSPAALHVVTTDRRYLRLRPAGPDTRIVDTLDLSHEPSDLAVSLSGRVGVIPLPIADAVDVVRFSAPGNFGCDPVVDLEDYRALAACLTGPNGGLDPGCQPADADLDDDVDLRDFAAFQNAFTGP